MYKTKFINVLGGNEGEWRRMEQWKDSSQKMDHPQHNAVYDFRNDGHQQHSKRLGWCVNDKIIVWWKRKSEEKSEQIEWEREREGEEDGALLKEEK